MGQMAQMTVSKHWRK